MEDDAADDLHVIMAHLDLAAGDFADDGEGFGQDVVERRAILEAGNEFVRLGEQLVVAEALNLGFPVGDGGDRAREPLHFPRVRVAQQRSRPLLSPIQQSHATIPIRPRRARTYCTHHKRVSVLTVPDLQLHSGAALGPIANQRLSGDQAARISPPVRPASVQ